MGRGTTLRFKDGTPGPPSKFKSGTPRHPSKLKSETSLSFFNEFIFLRTFYLFFTYLILLSFLNKTQININCELQKPIVNTKDKKVYMTTKKLSEETSEPQKIVNPKPIEVITILDHNRLAIFLKVYLQGAIAILRLPRETSKRRLREGT